MASRRRSTYTRMPPVPESLEDRYKAVLAVLGGITTVSEAARRLGLSRNRFQSLMHRGLEQMLEGLSPQSPGRPPTPEREAALSRELEQLRRDNERLAQQVETTRRMMGVMSDLLTGRTGRPSRRRQATTKPATTGAAKDEDPEPALDRADALRAQGVCADQAAAAVGASAPTLRRWRARLRAGQPPRARRGGRPRNLPNFELAAKVRDEVRQLRGLVGAEGLRRRVPGVSRRQAAALKKETVTAMERERRQRAERVVVPVPGVVRGFDAMYVSTTAGRRFLLVAGDACVPYRTTLTIAERYDGAHVAAALERDIALHGAPLVYRLDRAKSHETDDVLELLRANDVLVLHGPPHHPGFYGQLERQNREHRRWLAPLGCPEPDALAREVEAMRCALNGDYGRPTLGWRTAQDIWLERPPLREDRRALREEVEQLAAKWRRENVGRDVPADRAERIAIEQALMNRGYLRREQGGWC